MEENLLTITADGQVKFAEYNPLAPAFAYRAMTKYIGTCTSNEFAKMTMAILLERDNYIEAVDERAKQELAISQARLAKEAKPKTATDCS